MVLLAVPFTVRTRMRQKGLGDSSTSRILSLSPPNANDRYGYAQRNRVTDSLERVPHKSFPGYRSHFVRKVFPSLLYDVLITLDVLSFCSIKRYPRNRSVVGANCGFLFLLVLSMELLSLKSCFQHASNQAAVLDCDTCVGPPIQQVLAAPSCQAPKQRFRVFGFHRLLFAFAVRAYNIHFCLPLLYCLRESFLQMVPSDVGLHDPLHALLQILLQVDCFSFVEE